MSGGETAVRSIPDARAKAADYGLNALAMVSGYHRVPCDVHQLAHELALGAKPSTALDIVRGARMLGLRARLLSAQGQQRLQTIPLPAIIGLKEGGFAVIGRRGPDGVIRLVNPVRRSFETATAEEIAAKSDGTIILLTRRALAEGTPREFGLSWFRPSLWRYRRPLASVLLASLFVQLCGLVTPIFFQITIDKVLVHKGYSTLLLVVAGLVILGFFQVILQYFRAYVLSHTTSRIDVELGTRLFDHLLRLPLAYFESRPAGITVSRLRELETIRGFLTGQGLTSAIDLLFTVLFLVVLFVYSTTLATVVLISLPLYVLIATLVRPSLRDRIKERFNRSAANNQFLVETVIGMQTVKALAVEPVLRSEWEERLAAYVRTSFEAVMLAGVGQNAIQYINKLSSAVVLFLGAQAVISGDLTVGGGIL